MHTTQRTPATQQPQEKKPLFELIDTLSPEELEKLRLIAEGMALAQRAKPA